MLSNASLQTIVLTSRIDAAEAFYRDTLDLSLREKSDGALVFAVGGADLRVAPVPATSPSEHTVIGFAVTDLDRVIPWLNARGVELVRHPGHRHEADGSLRSRDGARVVWIRDPDGNLLSIVQFADQTAS